MLRFRDAKEICLIGGFAVGKTSLVACFVARGVIGMALFPATLTDQDKVTGE